jgi:uncharacterized protein YjiK
VVKEKTPLGLFQTTVNWAAGTASNGSAGTVNPVDLFNPALLGVVDIADVFALSNLPSLQGTSFHEQLLVLSEESGRLVQVDRSGSIIATLNLGIPAQHEGVAMDRNGLLYVVNELGGGDIDHPQLWVYAPVPEPAPAALLLAGLAALAWRQRRG